MLDTLGQHFQPILPIVSFLGSAASVGVTGYFWLVKMNRERPQLQFELVEHASHIDVGPATAEEQWLNFRLALVVVNNSSLPNAVLGTRVRVMPRGSGNWQEAEHVRPARGSAFPLNLPALQSGLITVEWEMRFPALSTEIDSESPERIVEAYLKENWDFADHVSVELRGLRGKSFTEMVPLHGSRMTATVREYLAQPT
ncbi:hypothetical protein [Zavarzinella formosa]|uniref:hypothetical protein n=1 Tax=Zavarzinella formosa TaxID=360055 RepID=UPI0002ECB210|nr:hypothetical protein [Zavarzinella formosa]